MTDEVLTRLAELTEQMADLEAERRALVAYARERVYPRPYTLRSLSQVTGMSISGLRTYYSRSDVDAVLADREL